MDRANKAFFCECDDRTKSKVRCQHEKKMTELKSGYAQKPKENRPSVNTVQLTENLLAGMALAVTSAAIYLNVTWVCKKYH